MVSKELGESLDRLSCAIALAEKQLNRMPQAEKSFIQVTDLDSPDSPFGCGCLMLRNGRLVKYVSEEWFDPEDGEGIIEKTTPLVELPVNERRQYAEKIANLIADVVACEPEYCREVDALAVSIEHAVADCQGGKK